MSDQELGRVALAEAFLARQADANGHMLPASKVPKDAEETRLDPSLAAMKRSALYYESTKNARNITVKLSIDFFRRVTELAAAHGISRNEWIRRAIRRQIESGGEVACTHAHIAVRPDGSIETDDPETAIELARRIQAKS